MRLPTPSTRTLLRHQTLTNMNTNSSSLSTRIHLPYPSKVHLHLMYTIRPLRCL